jgi:hypothetical protein
MSFGLPPTTQEQRDSNYEDIEVLLLDGFLSETVSLGGRNISFRTMFPSEIEILHARTRFSKSERSWKAWYVASSVWMIDGYSVSGSHNSAYHIYQKICKLPSTVINILFNVYAGLTLKTRNALLAVEAYLYEPQSRYIWNHFGRTWNPQGEFAYLGSNHIQRSWIAFNVTEDDRIRDMQNWMGHKLVASTQAPKAIQSLDRSDKNSREREETRRQEVRDTFYYKSVGLMAEDGSIVSKDGPEGFTTARTAEELSEEMRKWVTGEMDSHDVVVAQYKEQIRARFAQERLERHRRVQALKERIDAEAKDPTLGSRLVGYTADQIRDLQIKKGHRSGVAQIHDVGQSRLYEKYIDKDPDAGSLDVRDGRIAVSPEKQLKVDTSTQPFEVESPEVQGGLGDGLSLQQKVSERSVRYKPGGEDE